MDLEIKGNGKPKKMSLPEDSRVIISSPRRKISLQVRMDGDRIVVIAMEGEIVVANNFAYPAVFFQEDD